MGKYPFPPVTEAVIDIRFEAPLTEDLQAKLSRKLAKAYPSEQIVTNHGLIVHVDGNKSQVKQEEQKVFRRANDDQNEICLVLSNNLIVSQLAVYPGWDDFIARFTSTYDCFKKVCGYRKITRIGLRYINRIDISEKDGIVPYEEYLNIYVLLPKVLDPTDGYSLQLHKRFPDLKAEVVINSASTPSPLPNCVAFILDIDVSRAVDPPQHDREIFDFLLQGRAIKNEIFEAAISDASRKLFYDDQRLT